MSRERHSPGEVAAKLSQADELLEQGKTQREIAKILGISVMTYHRWRTARAEDSGDAATLSPRKPEAGLLGDRRNDDRDLELENTRLRNLVVDLLLEKISLQDALSGAKAGRRTKH
jgi:putative transposase